MERRRFIEICAAGGAACASGGGACAAGLPAAAPVSHRHARVKLVDDQGRGVKATSLKANHSYLFHYPFAATPCFLLRLDRAVPGREGLKTESGATYAWPGGVGKAKSIVAYSAICAHKLAYPTRQVSFIGFRERAGRKVIMCCAEKSIYDPLTGASVVSGPAPQPLAAILLEHDPATDELFATGTLGFEQFNAFFEKYRFKLQFEMGDGANAAVTGTTRLTDHTGYSAQTAQC